MSIQPEAVPAVSVVMPVLNEAADIERLLLEVLEQTPPVDGFEVLVADGGSTDGTREIVGRLAGSWPNLSLLDNPGRLSSAGRNVGARAARGKYVMFLDGHCLVPRSDYLIRLVEIFEETGADCLCRPQPLVPMDDGSWPRAIVAARHSWLGHNPGSDIFGAKEGFTDPRSAGAAYRREVIEALGGYDERFDACEDVEFNHRVAVAGYRAYVHPDLTVPYRSRGTLSSLCRQMVRYGAGRARLWANHPLDATPWPLLAPILLLVVGILTLGVLPFPLVLAVGTLSAVLGALVLLAVWRTSRSLATSFRAVVALATTHGGLQLGFWREVASTVRKLPRSRDPRLVADTHTSQAELELTCQSTRESEANR